MAKTSELKKVDEIQKLLEELKSFQEILDDKEQELTLEEMRACLGHLNYCVTEMIEQGYIMRESILLVVKPDNSTNNSKDIKNYFS